MLAPVRLCERAEAQLVRYNKMSFINKAKENLSKIVKDIEDSKFVSDVSQNVNKIVKDVESSKFVADVNQKAKGAVQAVNESSAQLEVAPDVRYTVYKRFCVRLRWCASRDVRYMRPQCHCDHLGRFTHEMFGPGSAYTRMLLPASVARLQVEGGAPYLGATGLPQYPPDEFDSIRSHPACSLLAPLHDSCGVSGLRFGTSATCAVTHDMQHLRHHITRRVVA